MSCWLSSDSSDLILYLHMLILLFVYGLILLINRCCQCDDKTMASYKCEQCDDLLCSDCGTAHQRVKLTRSHVLTVVSTFKTFSNGLYFYFLSHMMRTIANYVRTFKIELMFNYFS